MIKSINKKLSYDEMEIIAKQAMGDALSNYQKPDRDLSTLMMGGGISEDGGDFDLYFTGETPEDALVVCTASVNRITGETKVNVLLKK